MTHIIDFTERLTIVQSAQTEIELKEFCADARCLSLAIFRLPASHLFIHPNFRQMYVQALTKQVNEMIDEIDFTLLTQAKQKESYVTIFPPPLTQEEHLRVAFMLRQVTADSSHFSPVFTRRHGKFFTFLLWCKKKIGINIAGAGGKIP